MLWPLPYPWEDPFLLKTRAVASQLSCPTPSLWCILAVFLVRISGKELAGTLCPRLPGIRICRVNYMAVKLARNLLVFSLLLDMVGFCSSCHFPRNESRYCLFFSLGKGSTHLKLFVSSAPWYIFKNCFNECLLAANSTFVCSWRIVWLGIEFKAVCDFLSTYGIWYCTAFWLPLQLLISHMAAEISSFYRWSQISFWLPSRDRVLTLNLETKYTLVSAGTRWRECGEIRGGEKHNTWAELPAAVCKKTQKPDSAKRRGHWNFLITSSG